MSSIASIAPLSVPESKEMPSSSSSLTKTNLDSRIRQIHQRCDGLRKQKPKYLSLYQFGVAISVIGAAVSIILQNKALLICSVFIGNLFWKTISRNNDRIQSIDALQQTEIDQQRILDFTTLLQDSLKISQTTLTQLRSGLNADSIMADVTSTIGSIYRKIENDIQQNIIFLDTYDGKYGNMSNFRTSLSNLETLKKIAIRPVSVRPVSVETMSDFQRMSRMERSIKDLMDQLSKLDHHILKLNTTVQGIVMEYRESVNLNTELMNRWI